MQKARVPITTTKQFMKPSKTFIGYSLYKQYTELRRKQIRDWNKHRKEKVDVLALLKQKAKLTSRKEIGESSIPKME